MYIVTVVASVFAILWVIWQVQYQIADRITESKNRLRVEISETETRLEDRISRVEERITRVEDKLDTIQNSLDSRLDQVEIEQAGQRGVIAEMKQ